MHTSIIYIYIYTSIYLCIYIYIISLISRLDYYYPHFPIEDGIPLRGAPWDPGDPSSNVLHIQHDIVR